MSPAKLHRIPDLVVLVAKASDPEYALVIQRVKAVVTELGGQTSHLASMCRELGIPCVVDVKDVTCILKTGDDIVVNGGIGTVEIIDPSPAYSVNLL
jgi:pyruvate,water dikinase